MCDAQSLVFYDYVIMKQEDILKRAHAKAQNARRKLRVRKKDN